MQHNEETKLNKRTSVGSASCESAVSSYMKSHIGQENVQAAYRVLGLAQVDFCSPSTRLLQDHASRRKLNCDKVNRTSKKLQDTKSANSHACDILVEYAACME